MRLLSGVAVLLVLGVIMSGCGGGGGVSASRPPAEAAAKRTGDAGVTVELPPGWHAGAPADGNIIDPLTRAVISSAPIRPRPVPCQIGQYGPPVSDVTLVVVEWKPTAHAHPGPRPARFTRETLPIDPPPAIECFDGPGGTVQFTDHGRVFGAYLLAGKRAPERLAREALAVLNVLQVETPAGTTRRLSRNRVSIAVPNGWDGRMLFRDAAGSSGVIFQVANFRLPPNEGFEPPRELPLGQEDPIKAMDTGDVLVTVVSHETSGDPAPATIALTDLHFLPADAPRVPRGHALAEGSFCYDARCIHVEADFGRGAPPPTLRNQLDDVLASLAVK